VCGVFFEVVGRLLCAVLRRWCARCVISGGELEGGVLRRLGPLADADLEEFGGGLRFQGSIFLFSTYNIVDRFGNSGALIIRLWSADSQHGLAGYNENLICSHVHVPPVALGTAVTVCKLDGLTRRRPSTRVFHLEKSQLCKK
jgi:hypothetical protein